MITNQRYVTVTRKIATIVLGFALLGSGGAYARAVAIEHDSLKLLGNLQVAENSTLADGVVLIVHGTLAHGGMELVSGLQTLLHERGVNSLAITLSLGQSARQGMYDCEQPHRHRHHDAVAEIASWMAWLKSQNAGNTLLVGHSRGANQAARFALANPSQVRALALLAPATWDQTRTAASYLKNFGRPLAEVIEQARTTDSAQWMDDIGFLYCGPSKVTAGAFLSYYLADGHNDTPALLPKLTMPTLVIAGSADQTVPDVVQRTQPHVDDDTQLLVVEDADHFFRDLYAEDVADALAQLAQQHLP